LNRKYKDMISVFCLVLIVGFYLGYYTDSTRFKETFSTVYEKFDLLNSLLSPQVEGQAVMKDFSSVNELVSFLKSDKTNEIVYSSPDFVCHHFTETLIRNARVKGYRLEYLGLYGKSLQNYKDDYVSYLALYNIIGTWGDGEGHAVCVAYIRDQTIIIEPQSDVVFILENGRYRGTYMGEY